MAEVIDIYNANLEHQGTMERLEAHLKAQWHKTFHCWVMNGLEEGSILFQLRSSKVANFPNMLDVSAAGHLEAGEAVEEGVREVEEELGVMIPAKDIHFLGYRVEVADQSNKQRNREYQAVFLLRMDRLITEYNPQVEELTGLIELPLAAGIRLFSSQIEETEVTGIRYSDDSNGWEKISKKVTLEDFLPRIQNYYLTACIMAERLLEGRLPLSIS